MSLNELKAFHAVAVAGGFVRASDLLGRAQPTITAQVRNLERRHGVELFFRNRGQQARLTPLGERLLETTHRLFKLEADANAVLVTAGEMRGGWLRIGAISSRWATGLMAKMMTAYPRLDLGLTIENSQNLLDMVLNFQIDLAFIGSHTPNDDCHMVQVSRPEIAFVAAHNHPLAEDGVVTRDAFSALTLLHREPRSETRVLIDAAMTEHAYHPARVVVCGNREGALRAAAEGLGLAPTSLEEIPIGAPVCVVRAADFRLFGEVHVACHKDRLHLPLIEGAFELIGHPARNGP